MSFCLSCVLLTISNKFYYGVLAQRLANTRVRCQAQNLHVLVYARRPYQSLLSSFFFFLFH